MFPSHFQFLAPEEKEASQGGGVWVESVLANPFNDHECEATPEAEDVGTWSGGEEERGGNPG